jgi:hypothetical protein
MRCCAIDLATLFAKLAKFPEITHSEAALAHLVLCK